VLDDEEGDRDASASGDYVLRVYLQNRQPLDAGFVRDRCTMDGDITASMDDELFHVTCPYCGESLEIYVERDVLGRFVQDCEVCCNPWLVRVWWDAGECHIDVRRGDGSE
jgi:hypothetical protein